EAVVPVFRKGIAAAGITPSLWIEPGRSLVADSTILLTRVNSVKKAHRTFVNVDAGFNLLVRPVMYDSYHEVVTANRVDQDGTTLCTVAGPICETGDILASDRFLPDPVSGDILALLDCGAYGFAMSSQYNSRPRCPEILLKGNMAALMRRGETTSDLTCTMQSPPWQKQD
ncbi:MAG TPA: diaminopimelate decarboxylase, partial [Methanoregulaceae archaeon]|nr:diaminopimelate decarboxylase [Methanoregulaceae archaeon]